METETDDGENKVINTHESLDDFMNQEDIDAIDKFEQDIDDIKKEV